MNNRSTDYVLNNTTFRVMYGDITLLDVDVIVSSDDNFLSMGGGVSATILREGGDIIYQEARKHIPLNLGEVAVTSAGKLNAKYVFHAITIDYQKILFASEESIQCATFRCLQLADALGAHTIAFPALGTGVAGFPFELAAETITKTIAKYLLQSTKLEMVIIALFAKESVTQTNLNVFYERAVALASISTQAKRTDALLAELKQIVTTLNLPTAIEQIESLKLDLQQAQVILDQSFNHNYQLKNSDITSALATATQRIITSTSSTLAMTGQVTLPLATEEVLQWQDTQLELKLRRTQLAGLLTQQNIQISNLNQYQIERAKYGAEMIPIRLEYAITDIKKEIESTETQIRELKLQIIQLSS